MVDRITVSGSVFVDESEGRRGDYILYAQFLADSFYESCLSGTHLAIEGKDLAVAHVLQEFLGCSMDVV